MKDRDLVVVVLGVCLCIAIIATVVLAVSASGALAGSGLGALDALLGGALAWRVRRNGNGT